MASTDASAGTGQSLGLLEFHAALRRHLRVRPSQVNDHDVGVVFKYLTEASGADRASIHDFITWLNTSRFRVVSRGVMATRRFTAVLRTMGGDALLNAAHSPHNSTPTSSHGHHTPITTPPAHHLGHTFEPEDAAPQRSALPAEFKVGETIQQMAWKRHGWQRSLENAHHTFLSQTPKKLRPINDKRKALSDGAKPRGATSGSRSLTSLFGGSGGASPNNRNFESASVPGNFDDNASFNTVSSLRSLPF